MNKEVELPPLADRNMQDLLLGDSHPAYAERCVQLLESYTQIADLTAQVDGLKKDKDHWYSTYGIVFDQANEFKQHAEKAEAELAAAKEEIQSYNDAGEINQMEYEELCAEHGVEASSCCTKLCALAVFQHIRKLKAELAVLREGAWVYYRVDWKEKSESVFHRDHDQNQTIRTAQYTKESQEDSGCDAQIVEVFTRERILDATGEPICKHCGPSCIPGAAHTARAEDGVIWAPDATGGEG